MPRGDRNQWTGVTTEDRFWRCTDKRGDDDCWPWNGERVIGGYGRLQVAGFGPKTGTFKRVLAHRFSYELHRGKIPKGLTIDHLCNNPWCVNPTHLEAITMRENIMRGNGACAQRHRARLAREAGAQ